MRIFTPRPHQRVIRDHIINAPRCGVWAGMGLGKSSSTLWALDHLSFVENIFPALIVAPLRVARDTWPEEVQKWDDFKHLVVSPVIGTEEKRRRALAQPAHIYTINYDNLRWLGEVLGEDWPFKTVVADESTKLKGFRTRQGVQRAKALAKYAHTRTARFIELTGTPSPNGLKDLWGQLWFLDGGARLGRSYTAFENRWFQKSYNGFQVDPLPFAQEQITDAVSDICLSLNPADWFDLQAPIVTNIEVDMPAKARQAYTEMERRMFLELQGHEIEAFNAASKTQKLLQLCNGAAYIEGDNKKWVETHTAKIEALETIIEEAAGMPVLCAYNFVSDRARLLHHFPGAVDLATPEGLKKFKAGNARLGIGHPASIGHGIDGLQNVTNIIAFFGVDWNLETRAQIIERVGPVRQMQAGLNRPCFIYNIIARGTVDEMVLKRIDTKREVQDLLMEALKSRAWIA